MKNKYKFLVKSMNTEKLGKDNMMISMEICSIIKPSKTNLLKLRKMLACGSSISYVNIEL